jgi:hypothetical protein
VRQGINSSTIAIVAAVLMLVSAASAHLHTPAIAGKANNSLAYSLHDLPLGVSWLLPAKLPSPAGFDGDGEVRHSAEPLSPSACLDGKFPWIPVGVFDGFDAFKYKAFDPRTGQYAVYADAAPQRSQD